MDSKMVTKPYPLHACNYSAWIDKLIHDMNGAENIITPSENLQSYCSPGFQFDL